MNKKYFLWTVAAAAALMLTACGQSGSSQAADSETAVQEEETADVQQGGTVDFSDLKETGSLELSYATQFSADYYGEYTLLNIADQEKILLVPEDAPVPENVPEDVLVLEQPLDHVYLVSTSAMDLVCASGSLSNVTLSGEEQDGWYVQEAADAMAAGDLVYAGKYNMPDYELILGSDCDLAIENTMIYHNPEVKEKLEDLGIPVIVEYSSYEPDPLGRLEWIKFYGALFDHEQEAQEYFDSQIAKIEPLLNQENSGKTVAVCAIDSNGEVSVRRPGDFLTKMIEYAGGNYALTDTGDEDSNASTMKMQMEDFYAQAKDADVLIYNSTIEGEIGSVDDLIAKNSLFSDFKAVQEGNVYCLSADFFQKTADSCSLIEELYDIFNGIDAEHTYLTKLE